MRPEIIPEGSLHTTGKRGIAMFHFHEESDYKNFMALLEKANAGYDPEVKMHKRPFSSPGYHTTLKGGDVHSTRDSLIYAVALFDSNVPRYIERGKEIVFKVISLQDQNPENKTYGIWSWFYEEPLEKMAPPDWNWADFCGKALLQIVKDHREHLTQKEFEIIRDSIYHACRSIMRRNVDPGYTNISFMGSYVTHVAAEVLDFPDVLAYARERLTVHCAFNRKNANFAEYNSPTYTLLAAEDLTSFYRDVKDPESKKLVYELLDIAWRVILKHFHLPTLQWAGPHARNYSVLLTNESKAKLQRALKGRAVLMSKEEEAAHLSLETFRIDLKCPDALLEAYLSSGKKVLFERFAGDAQSQRPAVAYTYMDEKMTLGTFYKNDMWNQKRNLLAYLKSGEEVFAFRARCLHDFYDYSSAFICSAQDKGRAAAVVSFATDGGDTHCNLDMVKNATIQARDLRFRFTLEGSTEGVKEFTLVNNAFYFTLNGIRGRIKTVYAAFGSHKINYNLEREDNALHFDIILYSGEETSLSFKELEQCAGGFVLEFGESLSDQKPDYTLSDTFLTVSLPGETTLTVGSRLKAGTFDELYGSAYGQLNGVEINTLV